MLSRWNEIKSHEVFLCEKAGKGVWLPAMQERVPGLLWESHSPQEAGEAEEQSGLGTT